MRYGYELAKKILLAYNPGHRPNESLEATARYYANDTRVNETTIPYIIEQIEGNENAT